MLGADVPGRAYKLPRVRDRGLKRAAAQPKIEELHHLRVTLGWGVQEDVIGLQVAVYDPALMSEAEGLKERRDGLKGSSARDLTPA